MADDKDASSLLLKQPRELASWKFPLAQVIGEYFDNLPAPNLVNYGQAALIIQNAVGAYVRKVEDLHDVTQSFRHKVTKQSEENDERLQQQQKEKRVKKSFDFSHFEVRDLSKEYGKNVNLKGNEMKPVKFLHHCFSQLENVRSKVQLEIKDIEGEVIGKKYDFRCSQHMTRNGMLVEEFMPKDFESETVLDEPKKISDAPEVISRHRPSSDSSSSNEVIITPVEHQPEQNIVVYDIDNSETVFDDAVSGGCVSPSIHDSGYSSTNHVESPFTDIESLPSKTPKRIEFCGRDIPPLLDLNPTNDISCSDSVIDNDTGIESCSDVGSPGQPIFNSSKMNSDYTLPGEVERSAETSDNMTLLDDTDHNYTSLCETDSSTLVDSIPNSESVCEFDDGTPVEQLIESEATFCIESIPDSDDSQKAAIDINQNEKSVDCLDKRKSTDSDNSNGNEEEPTFECGTRRSKRLKVAHETLRPIRFEEGIPEKIEKGRKEFRLPCHIDLLKSTPRKRKTKNLPKKSNKTPKLAKEKNKKTLDSLLNDSRGTVEEDELEELQKSLDESISATQSLAVNYEPVTTVSMDLLGFAPSISKTDPIDPIDDDVYDSGPSTPSHYYTPVASPPSTPICQLITPSKIKISSSQKKNEEMRERFHTSDFDAVLKHKIKSIKEELNLITDEDQKVAKWHEEIKPRLKEAERKPPFQIHEYEDKIIKKLHTKKGRRLSFEDIVSEQPEGEVARYFSATLNLASSKNVDINTTRDPDTSIELILLD